MNSLISNQGSAMRAGAIIVIERNRVRIRLAERNGMSEAEARRRVSSQMSREERLERADFVIDNSTDVESMRRAIDELWATRVKERIEQA